MNPYPFSYYSPRQIKAFALTLELEYGTPDPIFWRRPDATLDPPSYLQKIPEKELGEITPDAFAGNVGMELAVALTERQIGLIGMNGTVHLKETIIIALQNALASQVKPDIARRHLGYIFHSPAWQ